MKIQNNFYIENTIFESFNALNALFSKKYILHLAF